MAISLQTDNTIVLTPHIGRRGGSSTGDTLNNYRASGAITPGMLIEPVDVSGENKWRPHAAEDDVVPLFVAIEQPYRNQAIADAYAANDAVDWWTLPVGLMFNGILVSGETVANSGFMESNGDGKLKAADATTAAANVARFMCITNPGTVAVDTRVRALRVA